MRSLKNSLIRLRSQLQLPSTLAEAGITPAQLRSKKDTLVETALSDPCCDTNPVRPESWHVEQILSEVMGRG